MPYAWLLFALVTIGMPLLLFLLSAFIHMSLLLCWLLLAVFVHVPLLLLLLMLPAFVRMHTLLLLSPPDGDGDGGGGGDGWLCWSRFGRAVPELLGLISKPRARTAAMSSTLEASSSSRERVGLLLAKGGVFTEEGK